MEVAPRYALLTVNSVDTVYANYTIYTFYIVDTGYTIQTALQNKTFYYQSSPLSIVCDISQTEGQGWLKKV